MFRLLLVSICTLIICPNGYAGRTVKHIIDDTVTYKEGKFNLYKKEKDVFAEPNKPSNSLNKKNQFYQKKLEELEKDPDGRSRVQETTEWPYLLHAQLSIKFSNECVYVASGVLVGPHHLLTSGHGVYSQKEGWPKSISVRLGLNDKTTPFGEIKATQIYTFNKWSQENNQSYDIALITLERSIGFETGWCGLLYLDNENILKEKVQITGYPGDKGLNQMWTMLGQIKKAESERFYYDISTYPGQGGSGIWINKWGSPYVAGIHTIGLSSGEIYKKSGVRLSVDKLEKISKWISKTLILQ